MVDRLMVLLEKPELNARNVGSLYHALWDDEHISKGMLKSHLDPDENGATCRHEFVFRSVQWIAEIAPPSQFGKLLDLGCGPGVYAERFAKEGYSVTGMDYSKRSLEYAREQTGRNGSGVEYLYKNYLTMDYEEQFDVITIINKDYAVFSIDERKTLLAKVYRALKPGGKFVFDVLTPKNRKAECRTWQYFEKGGFFCEAPHLLLEAVYQYDDDDHTEIQQYIVVTGDDARCFLCPNHYFTTNLLTPEICSAGFGAFRFFGDVAGKELSDAEDTICVVCEK